MLEIQTGRPTTRGSTMTFATTRAAGWVSTGMVAGWSIDNEISCNLDTSMILTPQPNSLIKNKAALSSISQNNESSLNKFANQTPKLYNGNRNFESRTLASHSDRWSML